MNMIGKNRVRAIFIGNSQAGKTSLIRALQGQVIRKGDIEITEWPVETNLTAHLWDFSAHVCENSAYRFFLRTGCVYVLVIDAGSPDSNLNQTAENQLEYLSAFDADARTPILLVGSKWDKTLKEDRYRCLCRDYPNIQGFYPLSSSPEYRGQFVHELAIFKTALVEQLRKMAENQPHFSDNQLTVIEALRQASRKDSFLEKHAFDELCRQQGIDEKEREDFLDLLDQLGEIIYFPNLYQLYGFSDYLLNPSWLIHCVHRILSFRHRYGIVHWNEVEDVLTHYTATGEQGDTLSYPDKRLRFLIRVMEEFRIFYPSRDAPNEQWIVPALLPGDRPERLGFDHGGDAHRFEFHFDASLPHHVFNLFIVEHYDYADTHNQQVWQRGVCLQSSIWPDTKALMQVDYQTRILSMEVAGPHVDLYFPELYASVLNILKRIPKLECKKLLHLNESALISGKSSGKDAHVSFEGLLKGKAAGIYKHVCGSGSGIYDLRKVLYPMLRDIERGLDASTRGITEKKSTTRRDSINTIATVVSAIAASVAVAIMLIGEKEFLGLGASVINSFIVGVWENGINALIGGVAVFAVSYVIMRYILPQLRNIQPRLRRWVSDFRNPRHS